MLANNSYLRFSPVVQPRVFLTPSAISSQSRGYRRKLKTLSRHLALAFFYAEAVRCAVPDDAGGDRFESSCGSPVEWAANMVIDWLQVEPPRKP